MQLGGVWAGKAFFVGAFTTLYPQNKKKEQKNTVHMQEQYRYIVSNTLVAASWLIVKYVVKKFRPFGHRWEIGLQGYVCLAR
jgi:hypothetical protein